MQPVPHAEENLVVCAKCGVKLPSGTKFCTNCGNPMGSPAENEPVQKDTVVNVCPKCGAALAAGARFCVECGEKIG